MAHHRLRHQAQAIAHAQAAPQRHALHREIKGTRRDERRTQSSIESMAAAEQAAIDQARREIKNTAGLTREDRAAALELLAQQRVNAAAGADYLSRESRRDFASQRSDLRSSLVDLSGEQGANAAAALQQLLSDRQSQRADAQAQATQNQFDAHQAHLDRRAAHRDAMMPTPTQQANAQQSIDNAKAVAQRLITQYGVPSSAQEWSAFEQVVASAKGVDDPTAAARAIAQLRKKSTTLSVAQAIAQGASGAKKPQIGIQTGQ